MNPLSNSLELIFPLLFIHFLAYSSQYRNRVFSFLLLFSSTIFEEKSSIGRDNLCTLSAIPKLFSKGIDAIFFYNFEEAEIE